MLFPFSECVQILKDNNITLKGVLHIGAHECEELKYYVSEGINPSKIDWIEANHKIADKMRSLGIPNIHCFAVDSEEGEAEFFVTNNGQSSSLLKFGTHEQSYPWCKVTEVHKVQKKRLDSFFKEHSEINVSERNLWVLDIQGSELNALNSLSLIISRINSSTDSFSTFDKLSCGLGLGFFVCFCP
jgi:FkbM family methyltransferase